MQLSIATVVVLVLGLATGFHLLIRVNHLEDVMARLKSLTIVAVLLVSGISLAMDTR